jgi:hypothetical protein
MTTSDIKHLLNLVEQQLDWGDAATWQSKDFEMLNQLIFDKTKVSLSASTLRRVWGRVEYNHLPSGTTLDTLAVFAGFTNWRAFLKTVAHQHESLKTEPPTLVKPAVSRPMYKWLTVAAAAILTVFACFYFIAMQGDKMTAKNYSFSSRRLTGGIPNSVIFNYDASASPTDSVFIQQSWDPRTKTLVSKTLHQHTSMYYEPGFYMAKLVVGGKIVKQHKLMIPTSGWLGLVENKPVPLYLKQSDYISKNGLGFSAAAIRQKNIDMQLQPAWVKYYNVGGFTPAPLTDFSFNVKVKNEYSEGAAACQFSNVSLITDSGPIIMPLSVKGCVSELGLISVDLITSGKTSDLSGLGVDFSDWVQVSCKSAGNQIQYYINDKLVYKVRMPAYKVKIIGMAFSFQGAGSVKNIELKSGEKMVFGEF